MPLLRTNSIRKKTLFLASMLLSISAVASDFSEAQQLAQQGDSIAQTYLCSLYLHDDSVHQDYVKAFEWCQKAAAQADDNAQVMFGMMYYKGDGVPQDYAKAFEWFQKAANQENNNAQVLIGLMYYDGKGVPQNKAAAKEWFGKACDNGKQLGCTYYEMLNQE